MSVESTAPKPRVSESRCSTTATWWAFLSRWMRVDPKTARPHRHTTAEPRDAQADADADAAGGA